MRHVFARRHVRWVLATVLLLLAFSVADGAGVAAGGSSRPPDPHLPHQSGLAGDRQPTPTGGAAAAISMSVNPYGCYSRSDWPHLSTTYPGEVDAKGWTICAVQQPTEEATTWLYRQDCVFWFICYWTQVGYSYVPYVNFSYGTVRAVATHGCAGSQSHTYLIQTYSRVLDEFARTYDAWTSNTNTVNCG